LQHKFVSWAEDLARTEEPADQVVETIEHDLNSDKGMKGLVDALGKSGVGKEKLLATLQGVAEEHLNGVDAASLTKNVVDKWLSQRGFTSDQIDVVNQHLGDLDAMAKDELGKSQKADVSLSQRAGHGDSDAKEGLLDQVLRCKDFDATYCSGGTLAGSCSERKCQEKADSGWKCSMLPRSGRDIRNGRPGCQCHEPSC